MTRDVFTAELCTLRQDLWVVYSTARGISPFHAYHGQPGPLTASRSGVVAIALASRLFYYYVNGLFPISVTNFYMF